MSPPPKRVPPRRVRALAVRAAGLLALLIAGFDSPVLTGSPGPDALPSVKGDLELGGSSIEVPFPPAVARRRLISAKTVDAEARDYLHHGEYQRALDILEDARDTFHALRLEREEAAVLTRIAEADIDRGAYDEAVDACNDALALEDHVGIKARRDRLNTLRNLGGAYLYLGQWQRATEELDKVLRLERTVPDATARMTTWTALSFIQLKTGELAKARDTARRAVHLARQISSSRGEANALGNLGAIYGRLPGGTARGVNAFDEAIRIYKRSKEPESEASSLSGRAEILELAGRLDEALASIDRSLALIESLRTKSAGSDRRATFFASQQRTYELSVRVLMKLDSQRPGRGFDVRAFEASETMHSRALLDDLGAMNLDVHAGADPVLVARESDLERKLDQAEADRHAAIAKSAAGARLARFESDIRRLRSGLDDVRGKMRRSNPRFTALTAAAPLSLPEIRQRVLDQGTLMLSYLLGEQESYLWAVDRESLRAFRLPKRDTIEGQARLALDALARSNTPAGELDADRYLGALSTSLLSPVAGQLGKKRLLIIPDGALHYIPFGALPEPGGGTGSPLLIDAHEIAYLPSASVDDMLRKEIASRRPAPKELAMIADPVFELTDSRFDGRMLSAAGKVASGHGDADAAERSARDVGVDRLRRLPHSGEEAKAILKLVPSGQALKATGFAATRELVTGGELANYRTVHLATHGLFDELHPERSGLVLSTFDASGRQLNGFLPSYEIYGLHLNADLVVLSACRTGLGAELRGEGLMGLTRGFMYAGVPRVVVSLWGIDDRTTADLMTVFYQGVLEAHRTPAAALRQAQLAVRARRKSPYYWAAFELQGEWR